jgi:hypothetical protein
MQINVLLRTKIGEASGRGKQRPYDYFEKS